MRPDWSALTVNRLPAAVLIILLLLLAVTPVWLATDAAADTWRFDLSSLNLCVMGEGDPDTPDLTGTGYKVYDKEGKLVEVDQAWLIQVLMAGFGNWFDLID